MRTPKTKWSYSVYCWDGWQRGHIGDFTKKREAVLVAECEAKTGTGGDVYYVQRKPGHVIVAEFDAGY